MSNFEKWQLLLKNCPSPQNFIDFSFFFVIAASLQRRVWCGPLHDPLYANQYVTLVGKPGIGKGRVIRPVMELLRYHKLERPGEKKHVPEKETKDLDPNAVSDTQQVNYLTATGGEETDGKKTKKVPLVIPTAPDAVTYEQLCFVTARATRYINYIKYNPVKQENETGLYAHASICFCLEELSSLFRKKTDDVVNYLIRTYDCGDYDYETKNSGEVHIRNCCVNILAGTQPAFLQSIFDTRLINEGYSSRQWYIYASEGDKRFHTLKNPELTGEQQQAKKDLIEHVRKLTCLYGPVKFSKEAEDFMEDWYQNSAKVTRPNTSPKLDAYYSRKNIHLKKLAMAIHFGEDVERNEILQPKNEISLATAQLALKFLDREELNMHYAINFDSRNPLAPISRDVFKFIRDKGPQNRVDLRAEFWDEVNAKELDDVIKHLCVADKIALFNITYPSTNGHVPAIHQKFDVIDKTGDYKYKRERVSH